LSLQYRLDHRTVDQFERDIKECSTIEKRIIDNYCRMLYEQSGNFPNITNNGVDNSGNLITNKVNSNADYLINDVLIEVKFCRKDQKRFHFKTSQLKSYIEQKAKMLFVNGYETDKPRFIIVDPEDMGKWLREKESFIFFPWKKEVIQVSENEVNWSDWTWTSSGLE
jgi:hypothetical protein